MHKDRSTREQAVFAWRERLQIGLARLMGTLGRDQFTATDFAIVPLTVPIKGLDPAFDGFRIVHISDLHMGHWINGERLEGAVDLINAQAPDLVAITGDFVSYSLRQVADDMTRGLSMLDAPEGVTAVLGNHDHWLDAGGVRRILAEAGVRELENDVLTVYRGEATLQIAGIDDLIAGAPDFERVLQRLSGEGAAVLLAHEPDFADVSAASGRFGLQLSGHSHGGQILLPGIGPVRGHMFRRYPLGRYQVGDMVQYTNPGLGTHVLRLRINVPPEITVITLRASSPSPDPKAISPGKNPDRQPD